MRCPHCQHHYAAYQNAQKLGHDRYGTWWALATTCANPECKQITIRVATGGWIQDSHIEAHFEPDHERDITAYPVASARPPAPEEVPAEFAKDYNAAARVLHIDPNAAAALSRRVLQAMLRDAKTANIQGQPNLFSEIEEFLRQNPPTYVAEPLHTLRDFGNFAAHPLKDIATDRIVDVDPDEAEWTIDVVNTLFDYFYVQPERGRRKKQQLNEKRESVGKSPI